MFASQLGKEFASQLEKGLYKVGSIWGGIYVPLNFHALQILWVRYSDIALPLLVPVEKPAILDLPPIQLAVNQLLQIF